MGKISMREKPATVTRNLPNYYIGKDYPRLLRLVREFDHMYKWHSPTSRVMIASQCTTLHVRMYGSALYALIKE